MGNIHKLIENLCPDGVEYVSFSDVCQYIRGITYNKTQEAKTESFSTWRVLRANNITLSTNTLNFDDIKVVDESVKVKETQILKKNDILICAGSGSKEHIGKVAFISEDINYTFGGFMAVIRCNNNLDSRFLFHYISGSAFKIYLEISLNSSTINNLNAGVISGFKIPLPPIEVQREIVRILDEYSEKNEKLIHELYKEIALRKKQYAYYRDMLLNFGNCSHIVHVERERERERERDWQHNVEWRTLGEVCNISAGGDVPKEYFSQNKTNVYNIPIISNGIGESAFYGYTNVIKISEPAVTVAARGTIGYAEYRDYPYYPIIRLLSVIPKNINLLNTKYLYYILSRQNYNIPKSGIPQLTSPMIKKILIPVPPIEEQERIVKILDRFDALCNDLTNGLPAEISARRKQYAYYRDKLLDFRRK